MENGNRYVAIIEKIFSSHFRKGMEEIPFNREEIEATAQELNIQLPKNIGDLVYSFRYRTSLPASIRSSAPKGKVWIIRPAGRGKYCFVAVSKAFITPNPNLAITKIPNATPGVIDLYALNDEQALLAKLRYNRLTDVFTGVTCYSLQSHLRTSVKGMGQVETDELYVGLDSRGVHYIFPVQAKGGKDQLNVVQIEQDMEMCRAKFPQLICRPLAAQFMENDLIAMFEFEEGDTREIVISGEKHYRLVSPEDLSDEELQSYQNRTV
ncbi:MAG: endonuclease [Phycisphaerae bacterium]|nr:endonuclease [Phycisphaerae bacterium]